MSRQLKKGLIKFCDISNEARPEEEAEPWADALMEEYFMQVGDVYMAATNRGVLRANRRAAE